MLTLYYKPSCPFCQRVLQMAENLNIELNLRDVSDSEDDLKALLEIGGDKQVPFLVDTEKNVQMYESNDIIEYLRENYATTGASNEKKPKIHMSDATCVSCEG